MVFSKKIIIGVFFFIIYAFCSLLFCTHPSLAASDTSGAGNTSSQAKVSKPVDAHYNTNNTATIDVTTFSKFTSDRSVGGFAQRVLVFFMAILGGVAMLGIIAGGIMIMSGGVSETTMEQGKDLLFYSIIGVVIALLSMVIVTLSQSFFYSLGT